MMAAHHDANANDVATDEHADAAERPARRSSSVCSEALVGRTQSRRSSAAARFAHFRSRAVGSADDKRVTFRATPSVRYFKSTLSASFGDRDDDAADEQQLPQYRAMRTRRVRQQLRQGAVYSVDAQPREALVLKIADDARRRMETLVRAAVGGDPTPNGWKRRPGSEVWDKREQRDHHVVVVAALPCSARELLRVLQTVRSDELEAALLGCVDERVDAAALLETAETTVAEIPEVTTPTLDAGVGRLCVVVKRVVLPRTKLADAALAWKRVRGGLDANESNANIADVGSNADEIEVIDCEAHTKSRVSRVVQRMATASGADHALVGNTQVGLVVRDDHTSASSAATVAFFLSKNKKPTSTKAFAWGTSVDTVSDALVARLSSIASLLWRYVERRRLGFQVLAYPDIVFCVDDLQEAQSEVAQCPVCSSEFGFLRRRHFCHLCALWVCLKCSSELEVESSTDGWVVESVKVCGSCQARVHDCVFDYDRGVGTPGRQVVIAEPEAAVARRSRLAQTWMNQLQQATDDRDRRAYTDVVNALMAILEPEESSTFRLSGLQDDWQDLAADEMDETLEELSEMLPVPFLEPYNCLLSHDAFRRQYVLLFEDDCKYPLSPMTVDDGDRVRRLEKLMVTKLAPYPSLEALCALAAAQLRCAMAFVSVVTADQIRLVAKCGTSVTERARDDGFDAYTMQSLYPLVVLDLSRDIRSRHFTISTKEQGRFYCGAPMLSPDESFVMAAFAVVDTKPRDSLTSSDYSLFMAFAWTARSLLVRELAKRDGIPAGGA